LTRNIFITGGTGQDGQILISLFKKKKKNIIILYRDKKPKLVKGVTFIKENLLNKKKLDLLFKKTTPNTVLHLAANNPSYYEKNYKIFFRDNFFATKNVFHSTFEANQKAKFIFCSSSQIFKKKDGVVNEKSKTFIKTDYTKFRIKSHDMMLKYKKKKKINYTNAILFNHDSKLRNKKFLLPRIILSIIKKDVIFLKKIMEVNIFSDFSHAEDICKGLYKLIFSNKNVDKLIFSSGNSTSINEIIKYIVKKYKLNIQIKFKRNKIKKGLIGENKLAKKTLKWYPQKNIFIAANEIYQYHFSK